VLLIETVGADTKDEIHMPAAYWVRVSYFTNEWKLVW
jgi:hypothetical protein